MANVTPSELEKAEQDPREQEATTADGDDSVSSISSSSSAHTGAGRRGPRRSGTATSYAGSEISQTPSRLESTLSRIRSRNPQAGFSHPLSESKTGPDVVVDFEGPDDP
nr:hypothetical protein CFP56_56451 [Quercus suber]